MNIIIAVLFVLVTVPLWARIQIQKGMITELKKGLIARYMNPILEEPDIASNEFVTFLSQSREWAFDYIETVQNSFKEFSDAVGPFIDHYDKFLGTVSSPHNDAMDLISAEYKKLLPLFPQEEK